MEKTRITFMQIFALLTLVLMVGCAGAGTRTQDLLAQNYRAMDDQELLTHYYQLTDQIAREERVARGASVGVGVGRGPVHIGARQGVTRVPVAEDLRNRRSEVRAELTQRGLSP
jgi:hypothetical protein